jgi:arginyl-tRNA synthetase
MEKQSTNELAKINATRRRDVERRRDAHVAAHAARSAPRSVDYPLPRLRARIASALSKRWDKGPLDPQLEAIDRTSFGGDLSLKLPQLLKEGGPKGFIQHHLPWIVDVLRSRDFADVIAAVQTKGMYINIRLHDRWFLNSAQIVADLGHQFGLNDAQKTRVILIDYSSPNIAKVLHAGHIRSTIIGHVLANLHEACGALVYRVNHINDFGGFGFLLEGYRRFEARFPPAMSQHESLVEIYHIRRTLERLAEDDVQFNQINDSDRLLLGRYFPETTDRAALQATYFDFVTASDKRFAALERGDKAEVDLWMRMVDWSLRDFQRFYDSLNIHIDFLLGESFYVQVGNDLVDDCIRNGTAILYTEATAAADQLQVDARMARGEIAAAEALTLAESIRKDIGAVVVPLDNGERFVIRRADGLGIYATRDLGAIKARREIFGPTEISYVVGQEQRVHFSRLFMAAHAVGIADRVQLLFKHIHFGFYVDATTGRKLSSRDTVVNVNQLLTSAIAHFRVKAAERGGMTSEELEATAQQLAIGSMIFNDLKQDIKASVDIDTAALDLTIAGFEKAGGAYVVYSACRARSIVRKHGKPPARAETIPDTSVDPQEALLLLKIQQIPDRIAASAEQSNPTVLVRHLLDIANLYNSYYNRVQVITNGVVDHARLLFTKAIEQSLTNALRICHIECPDKM